MSSSRLIALWIIGPALFRILAAAAVMWALVTAFRANTDDPAAGGPLIFLVFVRLRWCSGR